jgi:hypothetical protein
MTRSTADIPRSRNWNATSGFRRPRSIRWSKPCGAADRMAT